MAGNPSNIVVAGRAHVWLAPVGTIAPVDAIVPMPVSWADCGLTTEDSLVFATAPTFGTTRSHQSDYPTRVFQTGDSAHLDVDLQEFSAEAIRGVYGGGQFTSTGTAPNIVYRFAPPVIGGRRNVAAIAEVVDGGKHYRYVVPQCFQDAGVSLKLQKKAEVTLPMRLQVLGADGVDPWYILSDDPALAAPTDTVG